MNKLRVWFAFQERRTDFRTEILAGLTTFLSMMYILVVNPSVLSRTGIDFGGAYIATAVASMIATLVMGVAANYPIAIAPGIGINAYFVFTVILSDGVPWQEALGAAFVASVLFVALSLTSFRQMLIDAIPASLKTAIAAGIGLFIALIGLENGRLVIDSPTTITMLGDMKDPVAYLTLLGLLVTTVFMANRVRGAIFLGMIFTGFTAWLLGFIALPPAPFALPSGLEKTFFQLSFAHIDKLLLVIFTVLLVTLFDTTGTMLGVGRQAGLIREGKFPHLQSALLADSIGSLVGALLGTGPTSSFVESGTGVAAGGRTGFAAVVTAVLFGVMLFCAPLAKAVSSMPAVTAPALILVGSLMAEGMRTIPWDDMTEAFPAFFTMLIMPLSYSIASGVGAGFILYAVLKLATGQGKKVHPLLYLFAVLFMLQLGFFD